MTRGSGPSTKNARGALLAVWAAALVVAVLAAAGVDVEGGAWAVLRVAATVVAVGAVVWWLVARSRAG